MSRRRIAVIGSGVAGLTAASILQREDDAALCCRTDEVAVAAAARTARITASIIGARLGPCVVR